MQGRTTLSPSPQFSCARLKSTSPPDSAHAALRLSPTYSAVINSLEPAVLHVSEVVYAVPRSAAYTPTETTPLLSSNSRSVAQLPSAESTTSLTGSHDRDRAGASRGASSDAVRCCSNCSKIVIRLSQMLLGGVIIAAPWLSLDRPELNITPCHNAQCCHTAFRLQIAVLSQGLLVFLTGALLLCWNLIALCLCSRDNGTLKRFHTFVAFTLDVCGYALLLSSLIYTAWQTLSSSVYCQWPWYVYMVLILEETVAVILLSSSVGVVCRVCANVYCM